MKSFPSILLHGGTGLGIWEQLAATAAGLLCEQRSAEGQACGHCSACRLLAAGTHPDLLQLVPEALALELGLNEPDAAEEGARARNPGKDISIDAVRRLVDWAHATSHRGGVKVAVVYPLDAMAAPAANALLKTLEEPPPGLQFLMGTHRLDRVLPTLRSRCRLQAMPRPGRDAALRQLQQRGIAQPEQVAAWCRDAVHGAEPERGLAWAQRLVQGGSASELIEGIPALPAAIAALQKICVDALRARHGLAPLYLPQQAQALQRLAAHGGDWQRFWERLGAASAQANFPLHAGLTADRWVLEFRQLLTPEAR